MTNRERVIAAINFRQPDKTPYNVFFTKEMLEKMIRHTGNADYLSTIDNHITKISLRKAQTPVFEREGFFIDEFDIVWNKSGVDKDIGVVDEYIIKDAKQLSDYTPPPVDEDFIRSQCKLLEETKGNNFAIASIGFTLFERAWSLCSMEDLLGYMLTDPDAVECLFTKLTERCLKQAEIALEYDIDGIIYGDDWGQQRGMIMGPHLWRKFIKPYYSKMFGIVKSKDKYVLHHSCGDLKEVIDDLEQIGLDVYQTFQPEIYDIREYKEKLRNKMTVWGAISTQADLPFKSPEEIFELTKETIKILGEGGGYIAAPTHEVPADVPPENIDAMIRAFKE